VGAEIEVAVDGQPLARVVDTGAPYTGGSVGLYTEDAAVEFADIQLTPV
jgi:predicted aspartyl protease